MDNKITDVNAKTIIKNKIDITFTNLKYTVIKKNWKLKTLSKIGLKKNDF